MTPEIGKITKQAFADTFLFYLQAHYYHWNVEGRNFSQDHELLGKIYEEVFGSIDTFAEQLRALQVYTPASLAKFSMLTKVEDENAVPEFHGMLSELLEDGERMANIFKMVFSMAEAAGDHGLSDFLASRQDAHKKHSWMLRASLK